jgi:hypothetical protein
MKKENPKTTSKEVLFIVEQIDENQLNNTSNYHYFHNRITHRLSNKQILFKSDFYLIEANQLAELEMDFNKFKLIITESKDVISQFTKLFEIQECSETAYNKNKFRCYKNFNNHKIIVFVNNFNNLSKEDVDGLVGDIILLTTNYSLEKENNYFDEDGIFGNRDRIFYQWTCVNCSQHNLKILHKSEPKPDKCNYCDESILNSEQKLKSEMLILENSTLRTTTDKL